MPKTTSQGIVAAIAGTLALAACSPKPVANRPEAPAGEPAAMANIAEPRLVPPLTLDGYKKAVAAQVARGSAEMFVDPIPQMLKSVVVLEITIDRSGNLAHVAVRRSNGFKALENRAMDSVRRAAPFSPPVLTVRSSSGSVSFLETFLFRDDGLFQIRTLVTEK
jgi:protein TonB